MLVVGSIVGAFLGMRDREGRRGEPDGDGDGTRELDSPPEPRGRDARRAPRVEAPPPEPLPPEPRVEAPPPEPLPPEPRVEAPPPEPPPPEPRVEAPPEPPPRPTPAKVAKVPPAPRPPPAKAPSPPRPPAPPRPSKVTKAPPAAPTGRTGMLQISCSTRCEVRVDGAPSAAAAGAGLRVREGSHTVVVTAGGVSRTLRVYVPSGVTVSRRVGF
jgi:hypothetical protein